MKKQLNYKNILTETPIPTGAIAIISAAVYFLHGTKPHLCQQYLRSWNHTLKLCTTAIVCDHHDSERCTLDHWIYHLWQGIRVKQFTPASCSRSFLEYSKKSSLILVP